MAITARCRPAKDAGALGSSWINDQYTNEARHEDFKGLPETDTPAIAVPKPAYRDPWDFPVAENADMIARRNQLRYKSAFRSHVAKREKIAAGEIDQQVPRYVRALAPTAAEVDAWSIDAKAEAKRHADWLAKERADMVQRRLAKALRGL